MTNYVIVDSVPIKMLMNNPDIKLKKYNRAINIVFERTTYEPHLRINKERLELDYIDNSNKEMIIYNFSRAYQRLDMVVYEKVIVKESKTSKPEFNISIVFQHIRSTNAYTYILNNDGIMDSRGFFYQKGKCLNKYYLNISFE